MIILDFSQLGSHARVIEARAAKVLTQIRARELTATDIARDPRPLHRFLFQGTSPAVGVPCLAGHYRGSKAHPYLKIPLQIRNSYCELSWYMQICPPELVEYRMARFADGLIADLQTLRHGDPVDAAELGAIAMMRFQPIHPFLRGNLTIQRALVHAIAFEAGFACSWRIDAAPADEDSWIRAIHAIDHRNGRPMAALIREALTPLPSLLTRRVGC